MKRRDFIRNIGIASVATIAGVGILNTVESQGQRLIRENRYFPHVDFQIHKEDNENYRMTTFSIVRVMRGGIYYNVYCKDYCMFKDQPSAHNQVVAINRHFQACLLCIEKHQVNPMSYEISERQDGYNREEKWLLDKWVR